MIIQVNAIAVDALAPSGARASAAMALTRPFLIILQFIILVWYSMSYNNYDNMTYIFTRPLLAEFTNVLFHCVCWSFGSAENNTYILKHLT